MAGVAHFAMLAVLEVVRRVSDPASTVSDHEKIALPEFGSDLLFLHITKQNGWA